MAAVIYMQWTATSYEWIRSGHNLAISAVTAVVHRLHAYSADLPAHTCGRNRYSVPLLRLHRRHSRLMDLAAHSHTAHPPLPEASAVARSWGWQEADISLQSVMIHAEAASNRDAA